MRSHNSDLETTASKGKNFPEKLRLRQKPKLLEQVSHIIRCKHYSLRTEESYINWIKRYIFFHNSKHPKDMGATEISSFLTHLATQKKVAASSGWSSLAHGADSLRCWISELLSIPCAIRLPLIC